MDILIPVQDSLGSAIDKSLLIVDDDKVFLTRLARAMDARGFNKQKDKGTLYVSPLPSVFKIQVAFS